MEFTGKMLNVSKDWKTDEWNITFSINEPSAMEEIEQIQNCDKLSIKATKYRKRRSLDANALLWACLGELAAALRADKWDIYLKMLKRYGKYTYICVKPNVVDAMKAQWRECQEIGEVDINGQKAVQLLCYFGSSTYDSREFSILLDGVISEMKDAGIPTPTTQEMQRSLEEWAKRNQ